MNYRDKMFLIELLTAYLIFLLVFAILWFVGWMMINTLKHSLDEWLGIRLTEAMIR